MGCRFLTIFLLTAAWVSALSAQQNWREFEVSRIRLEGNETLRDDLLLSVIQTRETPSAFWKFLHKISEKLGDKPEYFDPFVFEQDYLRLRTFYQDQGFFSSRIDTLLNVDLKDKMVELMFRIHEGPRSCIDTIQFVGFDHLPSVLLEEVELNPVIKVGDPFVADHVVNERARIVNAFFNNGFADVHLDSVAAHRYASTNNIKLIFAFSRGKRYTFGEIAVEQDSTVKERVEEPVIRRHLDFQRGDFYSEAHRMESERNLNRLGVFEASRVEPMVSLKSDTSSEIPTHVFVRPRPFQELVPEIGVNDENNAFNVQVGISYNNRNFFGGARNFLTRFKFQLQSIQDIEFSRVFNETGLRDSTVIGNVELSLQLTQPYFFNNKTSFTPSVSFLVEKRHRYYFNPILRGRFTVTSQTARYTTGFLDWSLERIGYEPINPRIGAIYFDSLSIDRRPQFNSIASFTLQRDKRNDLFYPSAGFFHSGTIEEAGLIPSAFGGLLGFDLPYSKYIKIVGRGVWYWDPSGRKTLIWALRLSGGFAELYGRSPAPVPINRRFFAGGSGSVRGWKARDLGAFKLTDEGGNALFEASLEARWNLLKEAGRFWFVEFNKFSLVMFYDVGNVWTRLNKVRTREVAMASGLGLRYATVAGSIRIDFGFRVYDPAGPEGRQWITQKKFYRETLSEFVLHFGIGHAF
ncbi:MAG: BamA/TamA family outer membrane protein [Bacteroidota bacterium]